MNKLILITIFMSFLATAGSVSADISVAEESARLNKEVNTYEYRELVLKSYLEDKNSPLSDHAGELIEAADKYDLDWRLIPAITGVESSFARNYPSNSYNAYGWSNGVYKFSSWEESINIVSKTLKERYIDKGAVSIDQIGRIYAPPSSTWAGKVKYFMNDIDPIQLTFTLDE